MSRGPLTYLWRKLRFRYPRIVVFAQLQLLHVIAIAGLALFDRYQDLSHQDRLRIFVVSQILVAVENIVAYRIVSRLIVPADSWLRGDVSLSAAQRAWTTLVTLPKLFLARRGVLRTMLNIVPVTVYIWFELDTNPPWYMFFALFGGAATLFVYVVLIRFFALELILRPVVRSAEFACRDQHPEVEQAVSLKTRMLVTLLKTRMLVTLPAMNMITGVVVAALSITGNATLFDLGFDVIVAVVVSCTVALEISALLARSIIQPVRALREATERIAAGELDVHVPVMNADDLGELAQAFNRMVDGLREREHLHSAFSAFVDPDLAEHVAEGGLRVRPRAVDATILVIDIQGFTPMAEKLDPYETVAVLNDFFRVVVPVLSDADGYVAEFTGDGLLCIFGAPRIIGDHPTVATQTAGRVVQKVQQHFAERLTVGIGIDTGTVVIGTVGGGERVNFTVIGDAVNTATRVEAETRQTDENILITKNTFSRLQDPQDWVLSTKADLKGKEEKLQLYAPKS